MSDRTSNRRKPYVSYRYPDLPMAAEMDSSFIVHIKTCRLKILQQPPLLVAVLQDFDVFYITAYFYIDSALPTSGLGFSHLPSSLIKAPLNLPISSCSISFSSSVANISVNCSSV